MKGSPVIDSSIIGKFEKNDVVFLPGIFTDYVDPLRAATERAISDSEVRATGGFKTNRNMWMRDADFRAFVFESPAANIARDLMRTRTVRLYFDHLFVKEPGTENPTPWHQDMPYWPARGGQILSIWVALDEVTRESSGLVYVRGSHLSGIAYKPTDFRNGAVREDAEGEVMPNFDDNPEAYEFLSWDMKPGDCLIHHAYAIHGASGNKSASMRRRALSTRWLDENVRYDPRPNTDHALLDEGLSSGDPVTGERYPMVQA